MKRKFYTILASLFLVLAVNTSKAQDIVANGDFEAWTASAPDDWTTIETGITLTEETTNVHGGSSACNVLVTTASQGDTDFRQDADVITGTSYDVSLWVYQIDSGARATLFITGAEGNGYTQVYSDPTLVDEWQEITYTFDATATETIEIGTRYYDVSGSFVDEAALIIDDFTMTAQVVTEPTVTITSPWEDDVIPSTDVTIVFNTQNFTIASAGNGDGHLHYTVDGGMELMYFNSNPIELTGLAEGDHTVILKLVDDLHADLDPSVADTVNFSVALPTEVSTIADLRAGTEGEFYTLTGEAFVTYARTSRNQKYMQDATGGILIDDNPGVIVTSYLIGDGMTGVTGELSSFNDVLQLKPYADPGSPSSFDNVTTPEVVTLVDLNANQADYESELILIEGVSFDDAGSDFTYNANFGVVQDAENGTFRTQFSESDYIGTAIPAMANVTGLGSGYYGTAQFVARDLADIEEVTAAPANDNCDGASVMDLEIGTPVTVTGNGDGATAGAFTAAQVWEAFTLTECANVTLDFCGSATQASALFGSVYDCPVTAALAAGDIVLMECTGDSALSVVFTGLEAGTYYYPVVADTASFGGFLDYTLNMTAVACDPPIAEEGESFEGELFVPECWTSIDADGDGNDWFQYGFDGTAYAGLNSAASASWTSADGALNPDNYLVSPQRVLGDDEVLNYKVGAQDPSYPQEKYGVYISTTGNAEADFTTELFVETLVDGEWYDRTVDLSDYNGMTVYLAFRHYDVSDMFYMKLDNIILPGTLTGCADAIDEVEELEFSIYPNPNNGQFSIVNEGQEGRYIIELMDVTGKVVYSESLELNSNARTEINTSVLTTGVYLVKMTNTEENYYRTIRMVVK